jgi:4-hydroxybenzoyl-CoA thioesterase
MNESIEYILQKEPFILRRRVRWGECDPAGVVYTARFTDYLISAVGLFHESLSEGFVQGRARSLNIQTPCKSMSYIFKRALWPNEIFDMHVFVKDIRNSSYDLCVEAKLPDGTEVFSGIFTPVCISPTERKSVPIPDLLREKLIAYQSI